MDSVIRAGTCASGGLELPLTLRGALPEDRLILPILFAPPHMPRGNDLPRFWSPPELLLMECGFMIFRVLVVVSQDTWES